MQLCRGSSGMLHEGFLMQHANISQQCCKFLDRFQKPVKSRPVRHNARHRFLTQHCCVKNRRLISARAKSP